MALAESPGGEAFALFVDRVSIFCHDAQYSPGSNWQKDTKAMEESGVMLFTDRKVVASYNRCGARLGESKSNAVNLILRLFLYHFLHTMSS